MGREILIRGEEIGQSEFLQRLSRRLEPEDILHVLSSQVIRFSFRELALAGRVFPIHEKLLGDITVEGFKIEITSRKKEFREEDIRDKAETLVHEIAHIHFGDWDIDDESFVDKQVK